jgi:hypothetical protein
LFRDYVFHKPILLEGVVNEKLTANIGFDAFQAFGDALTSWQLVKSFGENKSSQPVKRIIPGINQEQAVALPMTSESRATKLRQYKVIIKCLTEMSCDLKRPHPGQV